MLSRFLSIFIVAAALTAPVAAEMPKEITFGIISTDSSAALRERWQPVLDDMAKRVGVKVTPFFATDYAGVIEAMRFKKVDLACVLRLVSMSYCHSTRPLRGVESDGFLESDDHV